MPPTTFPGPASLPGALVGANDVLYEVVNGQRVELPPMGAFQTGIASVLVAYLWHFGHEHKLGRAVAEMLFLLDARSDLQRRPDVAFVSYRRWPQSRRIPDVAAWEVVPELAVEVISRTNTADEVVAKVREYFQAGVHLVWVVYPTEEQVYVYTSRSDIRVLTREQELDGGGVLPGFRLAVAALFEEEAREDSQGTP
jgi:Uma2 family endonuclease